MRETRVLVLSLYYPPDLTPGSFRAAALVEALLGNSTSAIRIDVITSLPNRYATFDWEISDLHDERVSIRRIPLPPHRTGMLDQPRAFARFARVALREVRGKKYDVVCATSSRLMTAALGALIARRTGAPLYLDIRDIFVDTIRDVVPRNAAAPLKPIFSRLESWTIGRAARVNLVSRGFESYFRKRYPKKSFSFFTNGVDEEFIPPVDENGMRAREKNGRIRILYAGNIGEGQGLHTIVPAIAQRLGNRAEFRLIGDGGRRPRLEKALADAGVEHVELVLPMSRDALMREYSAADVLFLHLNVYDAFKKVLPSKIFEYAASGKPIWAGVSGYAAEFLNSEVTNAKVFPPCDVEQAMRAFNQLELRDEPRRAFVKKFSRTTIMRGMAADVLDCATRENAR